MTDAYLLSLEEAFPSIPWREPIRVSLAGGAAVWACRVCIARNGLAGREVALGALPAEREEAERHFREAHG